MCSIDHPTNRPNFTRVNLPCGTIWFSYKTPIAFMTATTGTVVRKNEWGPTTGKHLNFVDGGAKDDRIDSADFQARLAKIFGENF